MMISTLYPSRYSTLIDITECGTVSCLYVDFHFWITLLYYTVDTRTSIFVSVGCGLCPCVVSYFTLRGICHKTDFAQDEKLSFYLYAACVKVVGFLIITSMTFCME
jgi:hypothetical protein